ncbi:aminopeptidase N [Sediminivirga luteola]|uniref:Aminopeptidase N n=1 Tax=Sediminivirga luteola TaxID=1774748 RepID=A0A8J2XKZ2_9MICO|nr:aminopeptidase N [Sediminivirga luteola]MCI2267169.1 aminopeptidase N [Sediminivirga luteola]GGA13920.1 aminopeptidase N [Sediminivirga luteola]
MTTEENIATTVLSRSEARARRHLIRVSGYRVHLDLSGAADAAEDFRSETTVDFTAERAGETFIDFRAEEVTEVEINGARVDPAEVVLPGRVRLPGLVAGQNSVRIAGRVAYSRTGEGLHRFRDPADSRWYLYTHFEPADAHRVFANFDQPDLKARFRFSVTAPEDWLVRSNAPAKKTVPAADGHLTTVFRRTERMSSYIACVLAGEYHLEEDEWSAGDLRVPLGLLVRQSQREAADAAEIFTVTKQGLDFFHREFGVPYPWGKYDQAFVPEFNIGAMENPGLVTFTDDYLFRDAVTRSRREGRATTILHEMAHMWFGNLVTMRWWDDLWLKESFADYMGSLACAEATEFRGAWVSFATRRKAWAYKQDQLPTTHPIVADVPDVQAATLNFDGITYAKGASVLKQLVSYVGREAFFEGIRRYFSRHAWENTTLGDFLTCLAEAAPHRKLDEWAEAWLSTTGISRLTPRITARDGVIESAVIEQTSIAPETGRPGPMRPHRIGIGVYEEQRSTGRLQRTELLEVDVAGPETPVDQLVGRSQPALILLNDEDHSYAKVGLDEHSAHAVAARLSSAGSPMTRGLLWSVLWSQLRDGELSPRRYLGIVADHYAGEDDPGLTAALRANVLSALDLYLPAGRPAERQEIVSVLIGGAIEAVLTAPDGSDQQLDGMRLLTALAARSTSRLRDGDLSPTDAERAAVEVASAVLALRLGDDLSAHSAMHEFSGVAVDHELRWDALEALVGLGLADGEEIALEWASDATATGRLKAKQLEAAVPLPIVKARVLETVLEDGELSNDTLSALLTGWSAPGGRHLLEPYAVQFFDQLEQLWSARSMEMGRRLVAGLYPWWSGDPGRVLQLARGWLEEHPAAPTALRRLITERADETARQLRLQQD